MKLAYLISAYKDPKHLARLVEALGRNADCYIHIDKRVNIVPFERALRGKMNVMLISNRVSVAWGGFSQVLAIIGMLRAAFVSGILYDRILSITGSDYPIWSNQKLEEEFAFYPYKEYISGFNISKTSSKIQRNKICKYWFFDQPVSHNIVNKVCRKITNMLSARLPLSKSLQVRIGERNCDVYFGSDYWALTYGCAKHVYDTFMSEEDIQAYFRHAFAPSELFAQSIVFNSVFQKQAMLYPGIEFPGLSKLTPLHHIDYDKEVRVFSESDYEALVQSGKMFFRKASSEKSGKL